ncbi:MAG: calcium:proton antiporter [Xanthobacteraceae bacterium]
MASSQHGGAFSIVRSEAAFIAGAATTILFLVFGDAWLADLTNFAKVSLLFAWIFVVVLWCAFRVVYHADCLAALLGEPYGTLILTIAVIGIEVSLIAAMMLTGDSDPTLARDTMLAVVMIVLNGMVGVALLLGGLRHGEQEFNLQGARAFLAVLVPLTTICLILPRFTVSTAEPTLTFIQAVLFAAMTVVLYATFLAIQTRRYRHFFIQPGARAEGDDDHAHEDLNPRSVYYHAALLVLTMAPIVLLAKTLAILLDYEIAVLGAPPALRGVLVAILVLTPEALAAFKAALADRLQRSVNICLGSALATISLTVPAVLAIGLVTGTKVVLGIDNADMVLVILTLALSMLSFGGVRTNMLQGAVHLVVFFVYLVLIFSP